MNSLLTKSNLLPVLNSPLSRVYEKSTILNPRASFADYGFLPRNPVKFDILTGRELLVAGEMPVLCSSAVQSELVIRSFHRMGIPFSGNRIVYYDAKDYYSKLEFICNQNKKMVLQHVHPSYELDSKSYWIKPETLSFLNNKGNIDVLVPPKYVPYRRKVPFHKLESALHNMQLPAVIKAGIGLPTGGGYGVYICWEKKDIKSVLDMFTNATEVIIEEFIHAVRNFCIQFAVSIEGDIFYIGGSEQIVDKEGKHLGNWITNRSLPNELSEIGRIIMKNAKDIGYIGVAGFDILLSDDGHFYVIDLNFRLNGSTSSLLIYNKYKHMLNGQGARLCTFKSENNIESTIGVFEKLFEDKRAIPISFYDPLQSPYSKAMPFVTCLVSGENSEVAVSFKKIVYEEFGLTLK
ncbi:hypothetical protein NRS6120_14360 [Bacillus subtilis]|nr:ATP-grasp domain-containing protein [Bacillus subtilis]CAF1770835.1 hypothetical protein NRS6120_02115 [Bacillus subtilis]CAI6291178.1 hypothetical protein NRS6120_14360 [Bacillus subtilis]